MRPNDRMFADEVFCSHVLQRESSVNVPPLLRHLVPPMRWFQYRLPLAPEQTPTKNFSSAPAKNSTFTNPPKYQTFDNYRVTSVNPKPVEIQKNNDQVLFLCYLIIWSVLLLI